MTLPPFLKPPRTHMTFIPGGFGAISGTLTIHWTVLCTLCMYSAVSPGGWVKEPGRNNLPPDIISVEGEGPGGWHQMWRFQQEIVNLLAVWVCEFFLAVHVRKTKKKKHKRGVITLTPAVPISPVRSKLQHVQLTPLYWCHQCSATCSSIIFSASVPYSTYCYPWLSNICSAQCPNTIPHEHTAHWDIKLICARFNMIYSYGKCTDEQKISKM